jgi:hypothetical protein
MAKRNQSDSASKPLSENSDSETRYFNAVTKGLGYLNKVDKKESTGKDDTFKVSVACLMGADDRVHYERFQLYVRGDQALNVIRDLRQYIVEENKVTISFSASNCRARAFVPENGDNAGKLVVYQEGTLIFISSARVNGDEVYRAPERDES